MACELVGSTCGCEYVRVGRTLSPPLRLAVEARHYLQVCHVISPGSRGSRNW